jgi:ParB-like chromosome segregation protein Spo0J
MKIAKQKIENLNFSVYNPRKELCPEDEAYKSLAQSLDKFGYVDPIIWNKRTGNVVGGHQRLKVLIDKGKTEVYVSEVDMDDEHEKALNIALNKISGEWDEEKLSELLIDLSESDMVEFTGFSTLELSELLEPADEPPEETAPDDEHDEDPEDDFSGSNFNYKERYGVIVMCKDEDEQKAVYEPVARRGL